MRLRGRLPGQLLARAQRAGACRRERRLVVEELADRSREAVDVVRRRRRGRRRTRAPARRGRRRRRRPPARRRRARAGARRSGRAPGGTGRRRRSTRRARGRSPPRRGMRSASPATRSSRPGTREPPPRVVELLVRPHEPEREHRAAVVVPRRVARRDGVRDHAQLLLRRRRTPRASRGRARSGRRSARSGRTARRQRAVFAAVRRGSRSCAVRTSGARWRSSHASSSGSASHCTWTTSAGVAARRASPSGCSSTFSGSAQPRAAEEPGRERVEELPPPVAVRRGDGAEAEARGDELDLGARARERRGERVVVRRREGGRIGEDDAHGFVG